MQRRSHQGEGDHGADLRGREAQIQEEEGGGPGLPTLVTNTGLSNYYNFCHTRPRDTGEGRDCLWYGTTFCDGDLIEVGAQYDIFMNLKRLTI